MLNLTYDLRECREFSKIFGKVKFLKYFLFSSEKIFYLIVKHLLSFQFFTRDSLFFLNCQIFENLRCLRFLSKAEFCKFLKVFKLFNIFILREFTVNSLKEQYRCVWHIGEFGWASCFSWLLDIFEQILFHVSFSIFNASIIYDKIVFFSHSWY